jgi:hypothetical protein
VLYEEVDVDASPNLEAVLSMGARGGVSVVDAVELTALRPDVAPADLPPEGTLECNFDKAKAAGEQVCELGYTACELGYTVCELGYTACELGYTACQLGYTVCELLSMAWELWSMACELGSMVWKAPWSATSTRPRRQASTHYKYTTNTH